MKVLLIQMGDAASVVLSTLLIRCLKKQLANVELHLLVMHQQAELLRANPYFDKLHQVHFNWQTTAEELKLEGFDHIIDLSENKIGKEIADALPVNVKEKSQKEFKTFLQRLFQREKNLHTAEKYLKKSAALGVVNDGRGLDYFIPQDAVVPFADIPASHHAGFIAVAVSASATRPWPILFLQHLVAAIHHPIILIGTAEDHSLAEKIKAVDDIKVYNACGKFSVHETVDLIKKSKLLVAAHPYYVQTAAALKREIVWLQLPQNAAPYYSQQYLNTRTTAAFDAVEVPTQFFSNSLENEVAEKEKKTFVQQVVSCVQLRLNPRP